MPNEVTVDFTAVVGTRGRARSQRDISRFYDARKARFLSAGFTETEAIWAATHGLSPRRKQVRAVLKARKQMVAFYIRHGLTREDAIKEAAGDLENRLESLGIDEMNLFYEVSP